MGDVDELTAEAYAAYGRATGGLNHLGKPMPRWDDLPAEIRNAWRAAVQRVLALASPAEDT